MLQTFTQVISKIFSDITFEVNGLCKKSSFNRNAFKIDTRLYTE